MKTSIIFSRKVTKFLKYSLIVFTNLIFPTILFSQISTDGTVDINPYAGLQPHLIEGVSALPATGSPLIRHIYRVDKNVLALTIDEKAIINSNFKPYKKQGGDSLIMGGYHGLSKILVRKGTKVGYLCGYENQWLRPFSMITGDKLNTDWVSDPTHYTLMPFDDVPLQPLKVFRKTQPSGKKITSLEGEYTLRHEIFLNFRKDLKSGKTYTLEFSGDGPYQRPVQFVCDDRLRSEAIHINMAGYGVEDVKIGFLSMWLGDGSGHAYLDNLPFTVVDAITAEIVFSGTAKMKKKGDIPEYKIDQAAFNHNLTDIHTLDFSKLKKPGTYRLVIAGIGSSFDFEIRNDIWDLTSRLLMKGFLHQRSGIELGPPYTNYQRPRNMHPEDGFLVHKCDVKKFFGVESEGQSGVFERIRASILMDTRVHEAWGGWMDAGDFDQRMGHLFSVRRMMYLYELNPDYFESYKLSIPESTNSIPDILDEGAWCLDLYRRTQGVYDEGGISWWVESIAHPREGESSWLNSLPTALVPPTPRAGLHYAATAAQMALTVKSYDPDLSSQYLKSALAAMAWVAANSQAPDPFGSNPRPVMEALAYANLYRSTGDTHWHDRFLRKMEEIFSSGVVESAHIRYGELYTAYVLTDKSSIDPGLMEACKMSLVILADRLIDGANQNAFDIPQMPDEEMIRMVTLGRKILPIVMAHKITGDRKYTDALIKTMQYTMGANPMNRTYISGLGERTFMPYQHDWEADNLHIPAGIPNFGPAIQTETKWGWRDARFVKKIEDTGLYPKKLIGWPFVEKCFNNIWEAPTNEFTVRNPMGELLLLTGYLAQNNSSN